MYLNICLMKKFTMNIKESAKGFELPYKYEQEKMCLICGKRFQMKTMPVCSHCFLEFIHKQNKGVLKNENK